MNCITNYRIEPLQKQNYDTWKIQAQAILTKNGLWGYVSGQITKPEDVDGKRKWDENDVNAKADLLLIISPSELKQVRNCKTSKEVWDTLSGIYESKGPARKATLLKKLILRKMHENDDVRDHLNEFCDIVDKLSDMDVEINGDLLSIMILYSLPSSYENFRVAIESRDNLPKLDALRIKIIEESEARKKDLKFNEEAFFSKNRRQTHVKNKNHTHVQSSEQINNHYRSQSNLKCFKCNKLGHIAKNCRSRGHTNRSQSTFKVEELCLSSNDYTNIDENIWCLDSGCTSHMSHNKNYFTDFDDNLDNLTLKLASKDKTAMINGKGIVRFHANEKNTVTLKDTLYVPTLSTNLISVSKITDNGHEVIFRKNEAIVKNPYGQVTMKAEKSNGLFYINPTNAKINIEESKIISLNNDIVLWHKKLGHANEAELKLALNSNTLKGLNFDPNGKIGDCDVCIQGKFSRPPFPHCEGLRTTELLEIVHSDVCGPMRVASNGGARYFLTFTDEYSRYCRVYFLKQKNEVFEAFKVFQKEAERSTGKLIKYFQCDNERSEFCNNNFDSYFKECGIKRRLSTTYTPQQNGLAERKNRSLLDKARCLMIDSKLPTRFWAEAINTANYLSNRTPSRTINHITPFEKWVGRPPSVNHLKIFGAKSFAWNKNPNKGKFDLRAKVGIFVGYSEVCKAYRIWMPYSRKVTETRDVKVLNKMFYDHDEKGLLDNNFLPKHEEYTPHAQDDDKITEVTINKKMSPFKNNQPRKPGSTPHQRDNREEERRHGQTDHENIILQETRAQRTKKPPVWTTDYVLNTADDDETEEQEKSFEMTHFIDQDMVTDDENSTGWHEAIKGEIKSHLKHGTWKITDRKPGTKIIGSRMVLKNKLRPDGTLDRQKARLVAKGFSQRPGIDYNLTFAPVTKFSSIRLLLGIAVEEDLEISHFDISTAFLNGEIEDEIYMQKPENLEKYLSEILLDESTIEDQDLYNKVKTMLEDLRNSSKEKVCLLKKAVYGLKQAGRQWFKKLEEKLNKIGFKSSEADPCIYKSSIKGDKTIIAVYVDDILLASSSESRIKEIKKKLSESFEIRDLGKLNYCLGIQFCQTEEQIVISQARYIDELLDKFNLKDCKPVSTPMEIGLKLEQNKDQEESKNLPYQNLIGSLMYLSVATRPDISFAVSYLSQFNSCHGKKHWIAAKRVLRYLKGTKDKVLTFKKTGKPIVGLCDSDWAACHIDRRSYTGYCFKYAGVAISWESRKQRTVALSSSEAEYMALTEAAKEAIHLKKLAGHMGIQQNTVTILNDNQAAQDLASNPIVNSKSKHIDIKQHFIREAVEHGEVKLQYRPTEEMEADIFTKALAAPKFMHFRSKLGLEDGLCS